MAYYHTSRVQHADGTVLQPGHWGHALGSTHCWPKGGNLQLDETTFYAPWRIASEMMLEAVRLTEFADRPSRLSCVFLHPSKAAATAAMSGSLGNNQFLYMAELLDPDAPTFIADFALLKSDVRFNPSVPFLPHNHAIARQYWSGENPQTPEVITYSTVRLTAV